MRHMHIPHNIQEEEHSRATNTKITTDFMAVGCGLGRLGRPRRAPYRADIDRASRRRLVFAMFSAVSAATTHTALIDAALHRVTPQVASHAVNCAAKLCARATLPAAEEVRLARVVSALATPATPPLNSREVSKAAWGLGKLWSYCSAAPAMRDPIHQALATLARHASTSGSLDAMAVVSTLHAFGIVGSSGGAPDLIRGLQRRAATFIANASCSPCTWRSS